MLIVVSPAKALDFDSPLATKKHSQPIMLKKSKELVSVLSTKSPDDLRSLMSISDSLAELNFERYQDWSTPFTTENSRPAILSFSGDTYIGLDAGATFSERDFTHAQKTLRILSGLYGILRPLDLIQPYRLEMGSKLETRSAKDLYGFWGDHITEKINVDLQESPGEKALVNLASNEYFNSINADEIEGTLVTPTFLDKKEGGDYKLVSFYAKRARGSMASWIIRNRIKTAAELKDFSEDGYKFDNSRSELNAPVYLRSN
ncbi:MAG: peroxide stress protein YaaA [Acidimicrobiaceae bacterium]|nr:peroxide stress protein YaaA [Acidimicrobiaceae bacterium]|tara:strand:+ start:1332 stop:2111 length:780 start_codon:yes stop_codon:yes gene_type:complete